MELPLVWADLCSWIVCIPWFPGWAYWEIWNISHYAGIWAFLVLPPSPSLFCQQIWNHFIHMPWGNAHLCTLSMQAQWRSCFRAELDCWELIVLLPWTLLRWDLLCPCCIPRGDPWGVMQRQQCPQHPQQGGGRMCSFSTEHLTAVLCKAAISSASAVAALQLGFGFLLDIQRRKISCGCNPWASPRVTMSSPKPQCCTRVFSAGGAAQLSGAFPSAGDLKNLLVPSPSLESRGSETLRPGIANPFRLSCCFLMYATSLGGLSGLGTFYKRDLLMTKLMWLSYQVWEAYSRFKENLLE